MINSVNPFSGDDDLRKQILSREGRLDSDIPFLMPESNTPAEFIQELEEKVLDCYRPLDDEPKYQDLKGEFESFIQTIEKYKYLFSDRRLKKK